MSKLSWEAPEFEFKEKTPEWYYLLIFGALALIGISLWQNNLLFAVFLVITTILLLVLSGEKPKSHTISIEDKKVKVGDVLFYSYDELLGFSLKEARDNGQEGQKFARLWLKPKHRFKQHTHIPVPADKMHEVRSALLKEIPEVEHEESLTEAIIEWLRI